MVTLGVSGLESYCTSSVSSSRSSPVILLRTDPRAQTERDNIGSEVGGVEANCADRGFLSPALSFDWD